MKTAADYLDELRTRHNLSSDRKAAALLGVSSPSVVRFRKGEDTFGDATAARVAELLDIDPEEVLLASHAQRAKDEPTRAMWIRLARRAGYAGTVMLSTAAALAPDVAHAAFCIM